MRLPITKERAKLAKELLFSGKPQAHVAAILGCSQPTVSRIKKGQIHGDVPWPTGTTGAIPIDFARSDHVMKWSETSALYQAYHEELQVRILEVVNTRRIAADLPTIPEIAPTYQAYLETTDEDSEWEVAALEQAQIAEDMRISELMREFEDILDAETSQRKAEEIFAVLAATRSSSDVPELDSPREKPKDLTYRKLPWDEVVSLAGRTPIVAEAIANEDLALREACGVVFYELRNSPGAWKSPAVERQIRYIRDRFAGDERVLQRIGDQR